MAGIAAAVSAVLTTVVAVDGLGAGPASAAPTPPGPLVVVSPTSGLHNGQTVTITASGVPPDSTLLAVECSPQALQIGEDGCENHRNIVFFANGAGDARTRLDVTSEISTAVGPQSCHPSGCLLGVVRFTSPTADQIVGLAGLNFSTTACQGGTRCEDAPPIPTTVLRPTRHVSRVSGGVQVTPSAPYTARVVATAVRALRGSDAITGPYRLVRSTLAPGSTARALDGPLRGEGLLQLSMDGPGTGWASTSDRAVVVSARVDRRPWQQIVLFAGSRAFTYAGFVGPLATGSHRVSVRVQARLSATGRYVPAAQLYRVRLRVLPPHAPMYLLERYAPVVYGRANSASSDTQLLTYGTARPIGGGATELSYQSVWSHEDAGTSFVPFLEWGEWGRMTDITQTVSLDVSRSGVISHAMFNWCGCQPGFPENRNSLQEVSVPFHGRYFDGTHMIVRNASGNDYQSDVGATPFRFQQPAVAGPASGQPREAVMDAHPWTYQVMAAEVRAWYLDRSSSATSPQPGAARQYAIVSLDCSVQGASAVAVDLRLSGSGRWYQSDLGSGAPLYTGGLGRTVVKLPVGWEAHSITGVRLGVYPASATSALRVRSFEILGLSPRFDVVRLPSPAIQVVPGPLP